jgi:hypothetical protein
MRPMPEVLRLLRPGSSNDAIDRSNDTEVFRSMGASGPPPPRFIFPLV